MPTRLIVLLAVLGSLILFSGIVHRNVIASMIKGKSFKAPKRHVWLPEKMMVK